MVEIELVGVAQSRRWCGFSVNIRQRGVVDNLFIINLSLRDFKIFMTFMSLVLPTCIFAVIGNIFTVTL